MIKEINVKIENVEYIIRHTFATMKTYEDNTNRHFAEVYTLKISCMLAYIHAMLQTYNKHYTFTFEQLIEKLQEEHNNDNKIFDNVCYYLDACINATANDTKDLPVKKKAVKIKK